MAAPRILVNLPESFFTHAALSGSWDRLAKIGDIRYRSSNTEKEISGDLQWAEYVLMWSWPVLSADLLNGASGLKMAGHIDITQRGARASLAHGLNVSVSRRGFSPAVAEMALGLILSVLRRISDYNASMRAGSERWVVVFPGDIDPVERELSGMAVGIVGFGGVGRRLAELLAPFNCRLLVHDPFVSDEAAAAASCRKSPLAELLSASEVIVLSASSNDGTSRLLGARELDLLTPGSLLINVARAALVDQDALLERLRSGDIFAAIDVFDQEPLPLDSPLRLLPNAYLTPHRAGGVIGSVRRIVDFLMDDIEAHIGGKERRHPLVEAMIPTLDV